MKTNPETPIKNEVLIRGRNRRAKQAIKKYFGNDKQVARDPLEFTCECSDGECRQSIMISIDEYERIHTRNDRFIILSGHEDLRVDKLITESKNYSVVEKFALQA